jgi:hypothetical protein
LPIVLEPIVLDLSEPTRKNHPHIPRSEATDMANTIIMFWDRINVLGDPLAGIEVLSNQAIAVPANACGFRLCLPNLNWHDAWYFARPGLQGLPFTSHGITYSSSFTGVPSPDAIVARGPVHGCGSGSYQFQDAAGGLRHLNGGTRPRLSWAAGARSLC